MRDERAKREQGRIERERGKESNGAPRKKEREREKHRDFGGCSRGYGGTRHRSELSANTPEF